MVGRATELLDFLLAARTNDPRVVRALGERLPKAKLHVPLRTLEGVRNRPETAVELGRELPIHWLRLDNKEAAVPLFTSLALGRHCAERLGWETDGKPVKSLSLPGDVALAYLAKVFVTPGVDRAILNALSESELHLARTEVDAVAARRPLRALWFYARDGRMKHPVQIEGASFLGTLFSRADRLLESLGAPSGPTVVSVDSTEAVQALGDLESQSPLGALASKILRVVALESTGPLEVTVSRGGGELTVEAEPEPHPELLARLRASAEEALAEEPGDLRLTFHVDASTIVLRSSSAAAASPEFATPRTPAPRLSYIPLEPEERED